MPFSIVRDDIARVRADALVNAANTGLEEGGGVCGALFAAAGCERMRAACDAIGRCPTGGAVVTPAFDLPARWCIHAVGPVWQGGAHGEEGALRSCYRSVFARVVELGARSVAYPLISAGIYGYPADRALAVAREETRAFLEGHDDVEVTLVVFDRAALRLGAELGHAIRAYIDDEYVDQSPFRRGDAPRSYTAGGIEVAPLKHATPDGDAGAPVLGAPGARRPRARRAGAGKALGAPSGLTFDSSAPLGPETELDDLLEHLDASFSETLLALIDRRGMTDAEVYHRANLSRQLFSKIRGKADYRPTKPTAVALAMALELDLPSTQDLLARAGLTLSNTSKFDVIARFFIEHGIYDIYRLNEALFAYDQPLVGSF